MFISMNCAEWIGSDLSFISSAWQVNPALSLTNAFTVNGVIHKLILRRQKAGIAYWRFGTI
jgi:hypothetical protein